MGSKEFLDDICHQENEPRDVDDIPKASQLFQKREDFAFKLVFQDVDFQGCLENKP
jgi:hypothetical protein